MNQNGKTENSAAWQAELAELKQERNAVILAHNYQYAEIQDIADFVGDSLGLAQAAARTTADVILFCGVHFMAETAAILCPNKTVLIPDLEAGCSLADSINVTQLREWKAQHPQAVVVSYINTTAEIKAESDYCCTSGNAVKVIEAIPTDREILFLPDFFLGHYLLKTTKRPMHIWVGECHVHAAVKPEKVAAMRAAYPQAEFLIHPECGCVTSCMEALASGDIDAQGTYILSTEGMLRHTQQSQAQEFVVATETGVLHRMNKASPKKKFYPIDETMTCRYMKMITPEKVVHSLREMVYPVTVSEPLASQGRKAIERMLAIG